MLKHLKYIINASDSQKIQLTMEINTTVASKGGNTSATERMLQSIMATLQSVQNDTASMKSDIYDLRDSHSDQCNRIDSLHSQIQNVNHTIIARYEDSANDSFDYLKFKEFISSGYKARIQGVLRSHVQMNELRYNLY